MGSAADELARAAASGDLTDEAGQDLAVLLRPDVIVAFLDRAEAGHYRSERSRPGPTSAATNRVRVGCLNPLATAAGHPLHLPHRTSAPEGKPVTTAAEHRSLRAYLRAQKLRRVIAD